jgi:hypothetical protein
MEVVDEKSADLDNDLHAVFPEPYLHYFPADVITEINTSDQLSYYLMLVGKWGMVMGTLKKKTFDFIYFSLSFHHFFQIFTTALNKMLVSGRAFGGSTRMLNTYRHLLLNARIDRWFSEFRPVRTDAIDILYELLLALDTKGFCCFLKGTYVCYLAELRTSMSPPLCSSSRLPRR